MKNQICCFFGHGDTNTEIRPIIYTEIEKHILQHNITTFYVGGYGNFDHMSVAVLKKLKKKYPDIKIILVFAYLPTEKRLEYNANLYDTTLYPEGLETVPQRFAIHHRNRWIVEHSDYLITYVCKSYSGAYEAFQYAKRRGQKITNLAKTSMRKLQ